MNSIETAGPAAFVCCDTAASPVFLMSKIDDDDGDGNPLDEDFPTINDEDDDIVGQFLGYPEGSYIHVAGAAYPFAISYFGGDGNDVVLTTVPEPTTVTLLGLGALGLLVRRRRKA